MVFGWSMLERFQRSARHGMSLDKNQSNSHVETRVVEPGSTRSLMSGLAWSCGEVPQTGLCWGEIEGFKALQFQCSCNAVPWHGSMCEGVKMA